VKATSVFEVRALSGTYGDPMEILLRIFIVQEVTEK